MTVQDELKPCPFCGGHGVVSLQGAPSMVSSKPLVAFVRCDACGAYGERFYTGGGKAAQTAKNKAARAWNTRTKEAPCE